MVTYFNDENSDLSETLKTEIEAIPGINTMKYTPHVACSSVDANTAKAFNDINLVPTFSFVDPFGYKGLSLKIVNGMIKDWGCDCIFFFNYNRINAGISNPLVEKHVDALFGTERAAKLRERVNAATPAKREAMVLEELALALKEMGGHFVLPFKFLNASGARLSHSLVFVSKHFKGYEIMKEIMAKESSTFEQGVASFTYSPADEATPLLFALSRPLDDLADSLLTDFSGETLSMYDIYKEHSIDTPYIKKHYKDVLSKLDADGKITTDEPKRRKGTFADRILVTFP